MEAVSDYFLGNISTLKTKFETEFSKYSHYIVSDNDLAKRKCERLFEKIAKLNFKSVAVELTPSNTIKFIVLFEGERMFMIHCPFESTDEIKEDEAVWSFFIKKELIVSDKQDIDGLVHSIGAYNKEIDS